MERVDTVEGVLLGMATRFPSDFKFAYDQARMSRFFKGKRDSYSVVSGNFSASPEAADRELGRAIEDFSCRGVVGYDPESEVMWFDSGRLNAAYTELELDPDTDEQQELDTLAGEFVGEFS